MQRTRQLFPDLKVDGEPQFWAGLRPATPSNVPLIGRTRYGNLWLNTGHGTLGWTMACGSAAALADLMSGRRPDTGLSFRPMLIDTHCHLDAAEFDADRDAVHAAALAGGVERIVVPAVAVDGFQKVKNRGRTLSGLRRRLRHPSALRDAGARKPIWTCCATGWRARSRWRSARSASMATSPDVDPARQEFFFVEQLKLAREFDLPVLLHVRRAVDQILKHLRRIHVRGGIAHAFNGSRQQADEFIKLGFKLGFGGAMTFSGSTRIRALAAELPLESIVLETDAPDIPPAWLSGGRNTPGELPESPGSWPSCVAFRRTRLPPYRPRRTLGSARCLILVNITLNSFRGIAVF